MVYYTHGEYNNNFHFSPKELIASQNK
jgi:hypothetical protein